MIVQYIGHIRLKGTSRKTGNDYDFVQLHYVKDDSNFIGRATAVKSVRPDQLEFSKLVPDQYYEMDCDDTGNVLSMRPAKS